MTGIGVGVYGILLLAIGALALVICLFQGRRRRRGGIASALLILLFALGGFALLLPLRLRSQASVAHAQAMAMREQAQLEAKLQRGSMAARNSPSHVLPDLAENQEADTDEDASDESGVDNTEALVEETHERADEITETLNNNIESTIESAVGGRGVHIQTNRVPQPPTPPKVNIVGIRSGLPDRSARVQIVTGILLAGVVLAGYFFLNANTRGHYTWRLRIGSTLVFIASLVVIFLVTNCI